MIADTTFLSDLLKERRRDQAGPATGVLNANRKLDVQTTIISAAELVVLFDTSADGWLWLAKWRILRLTDAIARTAADIDRALKKSGRRLGENDNWIAAFALYYRRPLISHDAAFDRVKGLRRIVYQRSLKHPPGEAGAGLAVETSE